MSSPPHTNTAPPAKPIPFSSENGKRTPLSSILPPLIFGTATFNHQYNTDPFALDTVGLINSALQQGIRAFDTSPYYGPSEQLLGDALAKPHIRAQFPRDSYCILTKVGRVASKEFDYSAQWVRQSIARSIERLHTEYLDLVYCHDVEFVTAAEVLEAVTELRRIRDEEGTIRYIGISGYPIDVLADMAEMVLRETGEPLDAVQSYANYTLQNNTLASERGIGRLARAGVQVVPNASILGMGLLRRQGVPVGAMGDFHPAGREIREAIRKASDFCDAYAGEALEVVALRWGLETWLEAGSKAGSKGDLASGVLTQGVESNDDLGGRRLGVSVIGVSNAQELEKTMLVWRSILDGREGNEETPLKTGRWRRAGEYSRNRREAVQMLAEGVQETLGEYSNFAWDSPGPGFVNQRRKIVEESEAKDEEESVAKETVPTQPGLHVVNSASNPDPVDMPQRMREGPPQGEEPAEYNQAKAFAPLAKDEAESAKITQH